MTDLVSVDAGWAIRSKQPGTRADYAVLAASDEPLSEPEFASVLIHFAVGTPPTERDRPGSLPWVIISRVGVDQQIYLGLAIQDAIGEMDAAGRPIAGTTYFCVPYAGLERTPVSYTDLYEHLDQRREELPYPGRGLVPLSLPPFSAGRVAGDLDRGRFGGEQAVVSAAALLLSGPVSVTGAERTDLADRLGFLDAVAALLPYGFRAAFTGTTWSDSATRHPIRLAFAVRQRPEAAAVRWGTAASAPASGPGAEFHDTFQRIRAHRPGPEDLEALIGFLASGARMAPCDFDHPQAAIAALRDFGLPFLVWDEVLEHQRELRRYPHGHHHRADRRAARRGPAGSGPRAHPPRRPGAGAELAGAARVGAPDHRGPARQPAAGPGRRLPEIALGRGCAHRLR